MPERRFDIAQVIGRSRVSTEEKFYNVKIIQDGKFAWVMWSMNRL